MNSNASGAVPKPAILRIRGGAGGGDHDDGAAGNNLPDGHVILFPWPANQPDDTTANDPTYTICSYGNRKLNNNIRTTNNRTLTGN